MVWPHSVKPQTLCHLLFSGTDTSLCLHLHANHVNWTGWGVECFLCQKCSFISVLCGNQTLWYYYSPVLFLQITSSFSNILDRSNNVILRLKQWPGGSWGICAVGRRGAVSRSCWCSLRILFFFLLHLFIPSYWSSIIRGCASNPHYDLTLTLVICQCLKCKCKPESRWKKEEKKPHLGS